LYSPSSFFQVFALGEGEEELQELDLDAGVQFDEEDDQEEGEEEEDH
jgi:hypothetical protein